MSTPAELLARAQTNVQKAMETPLYAVRMDALYDAIEQIRATLKLIEDQEKKCH